MRVLSDQPIHSAEDDELNALAFARRLVPALVEWPSKESVVVGLYAPWGGGKSSLLNLLELELQQWIGAGGERAIPVRFNPWLYGDPTALLRSFFGTISHEIGHSPWLGKKQRRQMQKAVRGFGKYVVPVLSLLPATTPFAPIAEEAASTLEKLLAGGEADLQRERDKARKALAGLGDREHRRRLVILVDDLDRLEDDELLLDLRLVKLVADLPNTSYALAVDFQRVREVAARNRSLSYGQAYLEKIVQVPVYLPPVTEDMLERLVRASLTEVLDHYGLSLESRNEYEAVSQYGDWYSQTLGRRINTLRDRARLANSLRVMLADGDDLRELHPLDAVLVAFLQTFFPDAYERMRRNQEFLCAGRTFSEVAQHISGKAAEVKANRVRLFLGIASGLEDFSYTETDETRLEAVGLSKDDVSIIESVLTLLFPDAVEGRSIDEDEAARLRRENRIRSPERFHRYLLVPPPAHDVSDAFVDDFITKAVSLVGSPLESEAAAHAALWNTIRELDASRRQSFAEKLMDRIPNFPAEVLKAMALGALEAQDVFAANQIERALYRLARQANSSEGPGESDASGLAAQILLAAVERLEPVPRAVLFAADLAKESRVGLGLAQTTRAKIAAAALSRMDRYVSSGVNMFNELGAFDAGEVIWRWRDLLRVSSQSYTPIKDYLQSLVSQDLRVLPDVLSLFGSWSLGDEPKPGLTTRMSAEVLASADEIFGLQELRAACEEYCTRGAAIGAVDRFGLVNQFRPILEK